MKKITLTYIVIAITQTVCFSPRLSAQAVNIGIDFNDTKPIPSKLSGATIEVPNTDVWRYDNPELIRMLKEAKVGWLRYFGGTSNNYYDWKVGQITEAMYVQHMEHDVDISYGAMQAIRGIGGLGFPDFVELSNKIGAKIIITVNIMTDEIDHIYDLAKYVKDNNISVEYWQLSNEPWNYLDGARVPVYGSAKDHLDQAKPFDRAIKSVLPGARTSVFTSVFKNEPQSQWVEDLKNYPDKYWNSITFHDYSGGNAPTLAEGLPSANQSLYEIVNKIKGVTAHKEGDTIPLISTEWNSSMRGGGKHHRSTLYGGLYIAEFLARMTGNDSGLNIKYLGFYNGIHNLIGFKKKFRYDAINAYEQGKTLNTSNYPAVDFQAYYTVPGLALKLANEAINGCNAVAKTIVNGGVLVPRSKKDSISAIYAQAYKGMDGKNYLLIINKSAVSHTAHIQYGQEKEPSSKYQISYLSDTQYDRVNNGGGKDLKIQYETRTGPLTILPYSVTTVSWSPQSIKPAIPLLRSAQSLDGGLRIKWQSVADAKGYQITIKSAKANKPQTVDAGNVLGYEIWGLHNGEKYEITVSAYNSKGKSGSSNSVQASPLVNPPQAPHQLSVSFKEGKHQLSWMPSWPVRAAYETFEKGTSGWRILSGEWNTFVEKEFAIPTTAFQTTAAQGNCKAVFRDIDTQDANIYLWYKVNSWTGSAGVFVRYIDENNYYSLYYDSKNKKIVLSKKVKGKASILREFNAGSHPSSKEYHVVNLRIGGNVLSGFWENNVKGFAIPDNDLKGTGKVGLMTNDQIAFFDKIDVYQPDSKETYNILRSSRPADGFEYIARGVTGTHFADRTAPAGTNYYKVEAVDGRGIKSNGASIVASSK